MIIPQERALEISIHSYRLAYNVTLNYKLHLWWKLRIRNIKRALILYFFDSFFFLQTHPCFRARSLPNSIQAPAGNTLYFYVYVRVCKRVNVCMRAEARLVLVLVQHLNPNSFWLQESQRSDPHTHTRAPWEWDKGCGVWGDTYLACMYGYFIDTQLWECRWAVRLFSRLLKVWSVGWVRFLSGWRICVRGF